MANDHADILAASGDHLAQPIGRLRNRLFCPLANVSMTRRAARITQDEVSRMVKAVQETGLPIARVTFNGERVDVIIGERESPALDPEPANNGLLREPQP